MSSKRRLRRKSCGGKQAYTSLADANWIAFKVRRKGEQVHGYKCKFCKGYHIGH